MWVGVILGPRYPKGSGVRGIFRAFASITQQHHALELECGVISEAHFILTGAREVVTDHLTIDRLNCGETNCSMHMHVKLTLLSIWLR